MSLSPPQNDSSPPLAASSSPLIINQPRPSTESQPGTSASAEGERRTSTRSPESHHGPSISAADSTNIHSNNNHNEDSSTTAPPSISGSTATGTTMVSGASSASSPPPLFPPLAHHHHGGIGGGGIAAPPQLSVTNAAVHHHHAHATTTTSHHPLQHGHAHAHAGPSHPPGGGQIHSHAGPSRPSHPHSSTSSAVHPNIYHPNMNYPHPHPHPVTSQSQQVSTPREIESARNAVVASIGNMLDRELSGRATQLHANNAAIEKQEWEMAKSLDVFRKENDKLAKLAKDHTKKIKEIGNVQNWAEMLEREFLILESTLRMANRPRRRRENRRDGENGEGRIEEGGDESGSGGSWSGSASWSGSYSGSGSCAGSEAADGKQLEDRGEDREAEDDGDMTTQSGVVNCVTTTATATAEISVSEGGEQADGLPTGESRDIEAAGASSSVTAPRSEQGQIQPQIQIHGPTLSLKGKEREGDIQLALAEAMETSLILNTLASGAAGAGHGSGTEGQRGN